MNSKSKLQLLEAHDGDCIWHACIDYFVSQVCQGVGLRKRNTCQNAPNLLKLLLCH